MALKKLRFWSTEIEISHPEIFHMVFSNTRVDFGFNLATFHFRFCFSFLPDEEVELVIFWLMFRHTMHSATVTNFNRCWTSYICVGDLFVFFFLLGSDSNQQAWVLQSDVLILCRQLLISLCDKSKLLYLVIF